MGAVSLPPTQRLSHVAVGIQRLKKQRFQTCSNVLFLVVNGDDCSKKGTLRLNHERRRQAETLTSSEMQATARMFLEWNRLAKAWSKPDSV